MASPSEDEIEKAQSHFTKGAEFYALGDYSKAIVEFIQGHNLAPNAMFLYNISLSYERLDNLKEARNAAVKAKGFDGMPDDVTVRNEARIASFGVALNAVDVAENSARVDPSANVAGKAETESSSGFGALGWSGAALTAIGAASLVFALVLNGQVEDDIEAIDEARARNDFDEANRIADEVNSTRTTGLIFLFSGIGLATVGLSMVAWDLLDDEPSGAEAKTSLLLGPSSDGTGAAVGIRTTF